MHSVSDLYREILEQPDHYTEVRASIGGVMHTVITCSISAALNQSAAVGGTVARQIDIDILPSGTISGNHPILISVRLSSGDHTQKSEWIPKGTFWIDSNPTDSQTGVMSIHGFDAMLKMEQSMLSEGETAADWPKTPSAVMARICAAIGVPLDPRTVLNDAYLIPYPTENSTRAKPETPVGEDPFILNIGNKTIHCSFCSRVASIDPENRQTSSASVAELKLQGYKPCKICRPADGLENEEEDNSDSLSMRTVASYIAAMNGGNWMITDNNLLYLVPFEIFESTLRLLSTENQSVILFGNTAILL